jgi:hypothetical protein
LAIALGRLSTLPIDAAGVPPLPAAVPVFVSRMIEDGRSPESKDDFPVREIVAWLKTNRFEITAGVDSDEVYAFVC